MSTSENPCCILLLSGKRKSGKDFLADLLQTRLGPEICLILRLSSPLKKQYAEENRLDYEELLNSSAYKELYRASMIKWGEEKRLKDPFFFCSKTMEVADISKPVWIVSDVRRMSDVEFFKERYPKVTKFVRIYASKNTREQRGFIFTPGVDDAESECGLDSGVMWDTAVENNGNEQAFYTSVEQILKCVNKTLKT